MKTLAFTAALACASSLCLGATNEPDHQAEVTRIHQLIVQQPDELRLHLDIATHYFALSNYDMAKKHVSFVLRHDIPDTVRKNAEKFLSLINIELSKPKKAATKKSVPTTAINQQTSNAWYFLSTKTGYNDNRRNFPVNSQITDTLSLTGDKEVGVYQTLSLSGLWQFEQQSWQFKPTLSSYISKYYGDDSQDYSALTLQTGMTASFKAKSYNLDIPVNIAWVSVASEYDYFSANTGITATWLNTWQVATSTSYVFSESPNGSLALKGQYQKRVAGYQYQLKTATEFALDYSGKQKNALSNHQYRFSWWQKYQYSRYSVSAELSYRARFDTLINETFDTQRQDNQLVVNTNVEAKLYKPLTLGLSYQYLYNQSNQKLYEYDQNKFELKLSYRF